MQPAEKGLSLTLNQSDYLPEMDIKLSIIICTYNRDKYLPAALESLVNQVDISDDLEIIIVNNNSSDETEKICREFIHNHPELNLKLENETKQGLSFARNEGIRNASGQLVSFMDDDASAEPDYSKNLIKAFESYPDFDAVGGKVIPVYPDNTEPAWMSKNLWGLVAKVDYGEKFSEFYNRKYPSGCNMAFRKKVFIETGLFNTDLTYRSDDKYIFGKLRQFGKHVLYAPNVIVNHRIESIRLSKQYISNLCLLIGREERIRLRKHSFIFQTGKFLEYLFKLLAAFILAFIFCLTGKPVKSKIIAVRWLILIGFIRNK